MKAVVMLALAALLLTAVAAQAENPDPAIENSVARIKQSLKQETGAKGNAVSTSLADREKAAGSALPSGAVGRMLRGLGLCVGVLLIGAAVFKRLQKPLMQGNSRMEVLERLPLSPKSALILVRIDGKTLVVAQGAEQVTLLDAAALAAPLGGRDLTEETVEWNRRKDELPLSA